MTNQAAQIVDFETWVEEFADEELVESLSEDELRRLYEEGIDRIWRETRHSGTI